MIGDASTPPQEGYATQEGYAPPAAAKLIAAMGFTIGLYYFAGILTWLQPSMIPDKLKSSFNQGINPPTIIYSLGLATPPLLLLYFLMRKK